MLKAWHAIITCKMGDITRLYREACHLARKTMYLDCLSGAFSGTTFIKCVSLTVSAAVRLMPSPPALVLSMKAKISTLQPKIH